MYEELNKYVTGEKKLGLLNIYKASRAVEEIAKEEIGRIGFVEPQYKIVCVVRDQRGYDANRLGVQLLEGNKIVMTINKRLIDGLDVKATEEDVEKVDIEDRDRYTRIDLFLILFHELEHAHQSMMYLTNTVDDENLHKDALLRIYFNKLNKEYDYYADNYKVDSEEVLANIKAVEKTIEYFFKYNIGLTKEELEILKHKMDKYQQALNNTQRKNPVDGKMYDLDYLYKCAMEDTINKVDNLNDTDSRKY